MKVGIIGCGSIANTLVNFKLENKLTANLACFYDLNQEKIKKSTESTCPGSS